MLRPPPNDRCPSTVNVEICTTRRVDGRMPRMGRGQSPKVSRISRAHSSGTPAAVSTSKS
jgi:hypothetical protein